MQELAAALIVIVAFGWVAMKYMPAALRRRLSVRLAQHPRVARWFGEQAGCGSGCDTCGTCDTTEAEQAPPATHVIRIHRRD
jgi:hypothetical protein